MKGNEALGEAAIRAGCKCFFGYPITPQTELSAYMAKQMPKVGGTFLQAESEIAAINMVLGASSAGVRAMTSSSSPGISLKSEGGFVHRRIGFAGGDHQRRTRRPGSRRHSAVAVGLLAGDQGARPRGFSVIVYAPSSVQEMVDYVHQSL